MIDDFKKTIVGLSKKGHSASSIAGLLHTKETPVTRNSIIGIINRIPKDKQEEIHQEIQSGKEPELYKKHKDVPVIKNTVGKPKKFNLDPHSDEIKELYKTTQKPKEISRILNQKYPDLNVNDVQVREHLRKIGVQRIPGESNKALTRHKEEELYGKLKGGERPEDLASEYNISPKTIINKANKLKIKIKRKKTKTVWSEDKIKHHDKLVSQGVEPSAVAERLGVSINALNKFRSRTGRVKEKGPLSPDIIDRIKKIRQTKYGYKPSGSKFEKFVSPGEERIKRELFRQTGQEIGHHRIRKVLKSLKQQKEIKEENKKMSELIVEKRIRDIIGQVLTRKKKSKATAADKVDHARTAYKKLNLHLQDLKRTFAGEAHPDVQSLIDRQMEQTNQVLNVLNKYASRAKEKKKKVGFLE